MIKKQNYDILLEIGVFFLTKTTEQFIEKAKSTHENKFDYSKTVYTGWNKELTIVCPAHGEFKCFPNNHLRSKSGGCPVCNPKKKITTEQFIEKAKSVFPDYDYSKTVYINSYTQINAVCKLHGEFNSYPNNFLKGEGCPACIPRRETVIDKEKEKSKFIERANKIHNNKYEYNLVNYINNKTNVKIVCSMHGVFEQRPDLHLQGQGCPVCGNIKKSKSQRIPIEEFIKRARSIHNNKYGYSLVNYINNAIKIKIICPEHGVFAQTPNKHLQGNGCPKCAGRNRTTEEAVNDIESLYPNIYDLSKFEYINATTDSLVCCKKHNYWFKDNYHNLTTNTNRKCCCKEWQSNPNIYIKELLDIHNIKNIPEYRFNDCKNERMLPFDFYLPDYNAVIEYQGEWHYNDFKNNLKIQKERDKIKREYCKNNNIKEIEIPYWEYNNIEHIIEKLIS